MCINYLIMKVGIITYPGSNCDYDALNYFNNSFFIWHNEKDYSVLEDVDLLVIPGGFAFGDRVYSKATGNYDINPGVMAVNSPVTEIILEAARRKIIILGICNGFQILIKLKLLSGKLLLNRTQKFACKKVSCNANYVEENETKRYNTKLYIANSYGNYWDSLIDKKKVFLEYENTLNEYDNNIAGICNEEKTIFGMMPHPERNNNDFKRILYKILFQSKPTMQKYIANESYFDSRITELMASEHISYKTTKRYLKTLHTKEKWVIQGPGENAGIVDIGGDYAIAIRIESHNHPTFIDPFEGAATGVGGILRDIFAMGARPIALMDFLRFGVDKNSKHLLKEAINGISYYGNCIGVPNIGGDLYMHKSYNTNPLVNVACVGLVKKKNIIFGNVTQRGDLLIYIGSKTGSDGINGAAMASKEFTKELNVNSMKSNIQKSDPFLEKLLLEACCELSELYYIKGMQDLGAGGLLCATYEVVHRGREKYQRPFGCKINLEKVPTKYNMDYCDILISETQERMLVVADQAKQSRIFSILDKWDLEYKVIGHVTNDEKYTISYNNNVMYSKKISEMAKQNNINDYTYVNNSLKRSLIFNTIEKIVSKKYKISNKNLWEVYDTTVGNRTIKGPDKDGQYAVLDIPEVGKQLVFTWGHTFACCYNKISKFSGIKPLCIVNCLNFGHPRDSLGDFANIITDLNEKCKRYNIPIVGGNVSLYNSTGKNSIKPTPVLLMMGISL